MCLRPYCRFHALASHNLMGCLKRIEMLLLACYEPPTCCYCILLPAANSRLRFQRKFSPPTDGLKGKRKPAGCTQGSRCSNRKKPGKLRLQLQHAGLPVDNRTRGYARVVSTVNNKPHNSPDTSGTAYAVTTDTASSASAGTPVVSPLPIPDRPQSTKRKLVNHFSSNSIT